MDVIQIARLSMVILVQMPLQVYVLKYAETGFEQMRKVVMTETQFQMMDAQQRVLLRLMDIAI